MKLYSASAQTQKFAALNLFKGFAALFAFSVAAHSAVCSDYSASFASGNGSQVSPFQITTALQLQNIGSVADVSAGCYFHLQNDINLTEYLCEDCGDGGIPGAGYNNGAGWLPVNLMAHKLDGGGKVISGLWINRAEKDSVGLFSRMLANSEIKNIGMEIDDSKGGVVGRERVGKLVGYTNGGTISSSYANGGVNGSRYVGGLVGYNYGTINGCYASGSVNASRNVGGLVGYDIGGKISNSYYDSKTSGQSGNSGEGIPKTTEEMQSQIFVDTLNIVSSIFETNAWVHNVGKYPVLGNSPPPSLNIATFFDNGIGTKNDPYKIKTKEQLENMAFLINFGYSFSGKYIILANNIQLNDTTGWRSWDHTTTGLTQWIAIGRFEGTFDGNGYVVNGMYINTTASNQGLFGYVNAAAIKNVGVTAFYVTAGSSAGGLVGTNGNSTISNSYANGSVSGNNYVGGLVGSNNGSISNSYATGKINGTGSFINSVGGLVGNNNGSIINSYASVSISISGSGIIGGLAGSSNNSNAIQSSYWDIETSGQSKGIGSGNGNVIGKTTEEMQSQKFTLILNIASIELGTNAWVYSIGKYPAIGNSSAQLNVAEYFESGSGTENEPYVIKTKYQLENLAIFTNLGHSFSGEHITLANNILLNDTANWQNWDSTTTGLSQWTAIGTNEKQFKGTFNGYGYVVSGMYLNTTASNQGLFGHVNAAVINNIGVVGFYVKGKDHVGGVAGYNGGGAISSGYVNGSVSGNNYVGGLVGYNNGGTVSSSHASGNVSTYYDSNSAGEDNGSYVGGFVGYNNGGTIGSSYAKGTVSGGFSVGGLVGYNDEDGKVSNSYASGSVTGYASVGGFVGYNDEGGKVSNSYASGNVSMLGEFEIGGFAGVSFGTISNCYASGSVSGSAAGDIGGFAGAGFFIRSSYWDSTASGQSNGVGRGGWNNIIGKTTAQMQSQKFVDMLNIGSAVLGTNAWVYNSGKYPVLSGTPVQLNVAEYFESGSGTVNDPYKIKTKEQLENLAILTNFGHSFSGEYITLANSISLNDTLAAGGWRSWNGSTTGLSKWTAIGITYATPFKGVFNGAGYVVAGMYINTDADEQGLFGFDSGAVIKNVGAAAFYVKGGSNVGGLAGYNYYGTISNSYAIGNVIGNNSVGGLVGYNDSGTVSNNYASGNVGGSNSVGGLAGCNIGGTISNSYWDIEMSGQSNGIGGGNGNVIGKTTAEMQSQKFALILNIVSIELGTNAWIYNKGKYPEIGSPSALLNVAEYFESGSGTENNPYVIETKSQLENLAILTNFGHSFSGEYITLANSISLNDTLAAGGWQSWDSETTGLTQWTAIGTNAKKFKGVFDGSGYVVSGMYINTSENHQGLFGYDSGAVIKNIGVIGFYIKGGDNVGGLVGCNGNGAISGSYSSGNVNGGDYVGGLVGQNGGTVSRSYAGGNVSGSDNVGGLAGYNNSGYAISNSYAVSNVNGNSNVGGLAGYNYGTISNSYYAVSNVNGNNNVGGLTGYNYGTISNSYASGSVSGIGNYLGGFAGQNSSIGTISNSYYDNEANGLGNGLGSGSGNVIGKTTANMKIQGTFADWDFDAAWEINSSLNSGYPILIWQNPNNFLNAEILPVASQKFTGGALTPEPIVKMGATTLEKDVDYELSYSNNEDIGTATITITSKSPYYGVRSAEFEITRAQLKSLSLTQSGITYGETLPTYALTGNDGDGTESASYTVKDENSYSTAKPTNAGNYTIKVVVAATANYLGDSATADFSISKAAITLSVSQDGAEYGTDIPSPVIEGNLGSASIAKKEFKVEGAGDETYTESIPTAAGDYVTKVTVGETANYLGGYATAEFEITKANLLTLENPEITLKTGYSLKNIALPEQWSWDNPNTVFAFADAGKEKSPTVTFTPTEEQLVNYNLDVLNGWNSSTKTIERTLTATVAFKSDSAKIVSISDQKHTGKEIKPIVLLVIYTGSEKVLLPSSSYTVLYSNNVDKGQATAEVSTTGIYYGISLSAKFNITDAATPIFSGSYGNTNGLPSAAGFDLHPPAYYTVKGAPLGNVKPKTAGVYIEKSYGSSRIITVR